MKKRITVRLEISEHLVDKAGLLLPFVGELMPALLVVYLTSADEQELKELFWKLQKGKARERKKIAESFFKDRLRKVQQREVKEAKKVEKTFDLDRFSDLL